MPKKIDSILAIGVATLMTTSIVTPQLTNIKTSNNHINNLKSKEILELASQDQNINKEVSISVGKGIIITKTGGIGTNPQAYSNSYIPQNFVPPTGSQITSGTSVTYGIPITVRPLNGKEFSIGGCEVHASPTIKYLDNPTPKQKEEAENLLKQMKIKLGNLSNIQSTATTQASLTLTFPNMDWNIEVNPNISITIAGKNYKVDAPVLKGTIKYFQTVSTANSTLNENDINVKIAVPPHNTTSNVRYNPGTHQLEAMTIKLTNSDSNGKITPINSPYLKVNSDGTYTVSGPLLKELEAGKNIFTVSPVNKNQTTIDNINIIPVSVKFKGLPEADLINTTTMNYLPAHVTWTYIAYSKAGKVAVPMGQKIKMTSTGQGFDKQLTTTWSSNVQKGLEGSWKVSSVLFLENGSAAVLNGNKFIGNINDEYVSLSKSTADIFKNGTAKEKLDLMKSIMSGQPVNGVTIIRGSAIKNGTVLPPSLINMVIAPAKSNTQKDSVTTISNTVSVIPHGKENPTYNNLIPVIGKVMTFGQNTENDTNKQNFGLMDTSTDYLDNNAFLIGNINSVTPRTVFNHTGYANGTGDTTTIKDGEVCVDIASATVEPKYMLYPGVDGDGIGFTASNGWLDKDHTIAFATSTSSPLKDNKTVYGRDAILTLDMGASFKVEGPLTIGNVTIPASDYKIEGSKIVIDHIPENTPFSGAISVKIKYTTKAVANLNIQATLSSKDKEDSSGLVNNINGKPIPMNDIYNAPVYTLGITVKIPPTVSNSCLHDRTKLTRDNTSILSNIVHNAGNMPKTYLVIGQLPTASNSSLPGNSGEPSVGDLSGSLQSFEGTNMPEYVLPKSALDIGNNRAILDSTSPAVLKNAEKEIENPANGWVKYKKGMSLNGIIGYMYKPTIAPNQNWTASYKVKLEGIEQDSFQFTTSAFKYYDTNDSMGSVSNIVVMAPGSINLNQMWDSNVVLQNSNGTTSAIPKTILDKKVKVDGVDYTLGYLVAHGNDMDANWDNTPNTPKDHLQGSANQAFNEKIMKALGYELVKTTVQVGTGAKTQVDSPSWFLNEGISNNKEFTKVIFTIKKLKSMVSDTVSVTVDNKTIGKDNPGYVKPQVGKKGVALVGASDVTTPTIPDGYHITGVKVITIDESGIPTTKLEGPTFKVPSTLGSENTQYIYNIEKDKATLHVTVKTTSGKVLEDNKETISNGSYGDSVGTNGNPESGIIPNGYHISKITYDNNTITQDKISSSKLKAGDNSIVYTLKPNEATLTTTIINDSSKKIIETLPEQNGFTGDKYKNYIISGIKNGVYTDQKGNKYKVIKVTNQINDAKAKETNVADLGKDTLLGNDKVVYYVVPEHDVKVQVDIDGKEVTADVAKDLKDGANLLSQDSGYNVAGSVTNVKTPKAPNGYIVKSIKVTTLVDGKPQVKLISGEAISNYNVPNTIGNSNVSIIYNLEPVSDVTKQVIVLGANGKQDTKDSNNKPSAIVQNDVPVGTEINAGNYAVPQGYHLVKATIHQSTSIKPVEQIENNGKVVTNINTINSDINAGKTIHGTTAIVYYITKNNDDVTITYVTGSGKTLKTVIPTTNINKTPLSPDTSIGTTIKTIPGYELVPGTSITSESGGKPYSNVKVNGKTVTVITPDNSTGNNTVNITVHLVKIVQNEVKVNVQNPDGTITPITTKNVSDYKGGDNLIPAMSKKGIAGNKIKLKTPIAPNGYHIVKVENQIGKAKPKTENTSYKVSKVLGSENDVTTYTIAPNKATLDVTVNLVGSKTPLEKTTTTIADGYYGETIGKEGKPDISLSKYKIVSVSLNGKTLSTTEYANDIAKGILNSGANHVIYNVEPIVGKVMVKVVTDTGKVVVANKMVQNGNIDTPLTGYTEPILSNEYKDYHLVNTTIQVNDNKASSVNQKELAKDKIVEGTTQIVYTIAKNSTSTTKITYVTGNGDTPVPNTPPTVITIPGGSTTTVTLKPPKGYHLVPNNPVTNNGITVTPNKDNKITVTTGTLDKGKDNNVVVRVAKNVTNNVTYTIVTNTGSTLVDSTNIQTGVIPGTNVSGNIKIPAGYELVPVKDNPITGNIGKVEYTQNGSDIKVTTPTSSNIDKEIDTHIKVIVQKIPTYTTTITYKTPGGDIVGTPIVVGIPVVGGSSVPIKITVPGGYHISTGTSITNNGSKIPNVVPSTGKTFTVTTGTSTDGHNNNIVITVQKNPPAIVHGKVTVTVETKDGTIKVPTKTTEGVDGASIIGSATGYTNVPGYHVVGLTVNGTPVQKTSTGAYIVPSMNYTNGTQNVVWIIAKNTPKPIPKPVVKHGTVTVTVETSNGTIVVPSKSTEGVDGSSVSGNVTGYTNVPGYHVVGLTVNGTPVQKTSTGAYIVPPMSYTDGSQNVVWIVSKDTPKPTPKPEEKTGSVSVEIKTDTGVILVPSHTVKKGDEGTVVSKGLGYVPQKGYHLTGTTINGVSKGDVSVSKVTLMNGSTKIVYTVASNPDSTPVPKPEVKTGSVSVEIKTNTGIILVPSHTVKTGEEGIVVNKGLGYISQKGYHLVGTTINGKSKGDVSVTEVTLNNGDTKIVYTVASNPDSTPVPKPEVKTGNVTVSIITTDGKVLVPVHIVKTGKEETEVDNGISYTSQKGYHLVGATINGESKGDVSISKVTLTDGTTNIVYTVSSDVNPKIETGKVTVSVVDGNGQVIVSPHIVSSGTVGSKVSNTSTSYTPPKGYHISKITIDGKSVSNVPSINIENGDTSIIYTISKDKTKTPSKVTTPDTGSVTVTVETPNGNVLVPATKVQQGVVGTKITGTNTVIPKGYHIVSIVDNGHKVDKIPSNITKGNTNITYIVGKDIPNDKKITRNKVDTPQISVNNFIPNSNSIPSNDSPEGIIVNSNKVPTVAINKATKKTVISTLPDTGLNKDVNNGFKNIEVGLASLLGLSALLAFIRKIKK